MTSDENSNSYDSTQVQVERPENSETATGSAGSKPQFSVKSKEGGYVGSAWMRDGQYGRYLSVTLNQDVPKGTRMYISPNRANAGLLG